VPLDIIHKHAKKDVCAHVVLETVMDREHLQIHGLERAECPLNILRDRRAVISIS
jgi:hypothetical protein